MSKFILVTSCEEQQGKTVISLELAKKLSNEGSVVYQVQQKMHRYILNMT